MTVHESLQCTDRGRYHIHHLRFLYICLPCNLTISYGPLGLVKWSIHVTLKHTSTSPPLLPATQRAPVLGKTGQGRDSNKTAKGRGGPPAADTQDAVPKTPPACLRHLKTRAQTHRWATQRPIIAEPRRTDMGSRTPAHTSTRSNQLYYLVQTPDQRLNHPYHPLQINRIILIITSSPQPSSSSSSSYVSGGSAEGGKMRASSSESLHACV